MFRRNFVEIGVRVFVQTGSAVSAHYLFCLYYMSLGVCVQVLLPWKKWSDARVNKKFLAESTSLYTNTALFFYILVHT